MMHVAIPFTQYMLPDGQRKKVSMPCQKVTHTKACQIMEAGFAFEIEILSTGMVSATITDKRGDTGDVAFYVGANDETLPQGIAEMIDYFDIEYAWRQRAGKEDAE